jgi:glycosyltransferase involved in cell wall biosynthesis
MVLLTQEYPPDSRVEGEVEALIRGGHSVYMLTIRDGGYHPHAHTPQTFKLPKWLFPAKSYPVLCVSLLFTLFYLKFKWGIEWVHVHDITHAVPTVVFCKILRLRVTSDIHEDFVDALRTRSSRAHQVKKWGYLALAWVFSVLEKIIVFSDQIITITPLETERWVDLGADPGHVIDIPNIMTVPIIEKLRLTPTEPPTPVITYVGGFSFHRGLETLVEAMREHPNARLELIGDGHLAPYLKALARSMDNVYFWGHLPFRFAMKQIAQCTVFVIPYLRTRQTDKSSPHKLYQAMSLGKPIIVSDCPALLQVVNEAQCGISFVARSPRSLARKIRFLLDNPLMRKELGENGRSYISVNSWERESQKLLRIYEGKK